MGKQEGGNGRGTPRGIAKLGGRGRGAGGGGGGAGGQTRGADIGKYKAWVNDPGKVMKWMSRYDLKKLLRAGGGIVKIQNFLPDFVADGILATVEGITEKEWNMTAAGRDYEQNNISHKFWSTKSAAGLDEITRMFSCLMPEKLNTAFSAAKYVQSHHIEPHDDRAYADVRMEGGSVIQCSREIAVIYYLTKDWKESFGGTLIDCQTGDHYVPEFNSLIVFKIPRYHEVCAVSSPSRPRYSVFGWFLREGKMYELFKGDNGEERPKSMSKRLTSQAEQDENQTTKTCAQKLVRDASKKSLSTKKCSAAAAEGRGVTETGVENGKARAHTSNTHLSSQEDDSDYIGRIGCVPRKRRRMPPS